MDFGRFGMIKMMIFIGKANYADGCIAIERGVSR